jgi:hypothetical protein
MLTNDTPIVTPEDDQFGVDPFARALAKALSEMPSPSSLLRTRLGNGARKVGFLGVRRQNGPFPPARPI